MKCGICSEDVSFDKIYEDVRFMEGIPLMAIYDKDACDGRVYHRFCILKWIIECAIDTGRSSSPLCPVARKPIRSLLALNFQLRETIIPDPEYRGKFITVRSYPGLREREAMRGKHRRAEIERASVREIANVQVQEQWRGQAQVQMVSSGEILAHREDIQELENLQLEVFLGNGLPDADRTTHTVRPGRSNYETDSTRRGDGMGPVVRRRRRIHARPRYDLTRASTNGVAQPIMNKQVPHNTEGNEVGIGIMLPSSAIQLGVAASVAASVGSSIVSISDQERVNPVAGSGVGTSDQTRNQEDYANVGGDKPCLQHADRGDLQMPNEALVEDTYEIQEEAREEPLANEIMEETR